MNLCYKRRFMPITTAYYTTTVTNLKVSGYRFYNGLAALHLLMLELRRLHSVQSEQISAVAPSLYAKVVGDKLSMISQPYRQIYVLKITAVLDTKWRRRRHARPVDRQLQSPASALLTNW